MSRCAASLLVLVAIGCGRSGVDPSPTRIPKGSTSPTPAANVILGWVRDTAFRMVDGARVEIVEGSQAGQSTTTDNAGQFEFVGRFVGSLTLRAAKDGYAEATKRLTISTYSTTQQVSFDLDSLAPAAEIAGECVLTLTADSECVNLPDEARTRRYEATIVPSSISSFFRGSVSGASFVGDFKWFAVGVAGDHVAFSVDFDGPTIVEELASRSYLAIDGLGEGSARTSRVSEMSVPFDGYIDYCVLKPESPMNYSGCFTADHTDMHAQCTSKNHRLTLTRR